MKAATAIKSPLRASVFQPTGVECNWPKQRQSGLRSWARLAPIPTTKASNSASAPKAPHHAATAGTSAARSEEHTSELQSHSDLHSFPTRRSSDLAVLGEVSAYPNDEG